MRYHPFYCEENAYHLAGHEVFAGRRRYVAFITNADRSVAMWHQRAARRPGTAIVWDYHVIVIAEGPWEVWDLDTTLAFPVAASEYLRRSFRAGTPEEFWPSFRLTEAERFREVFATDRSHMRRKDGRYLRPPPPWETIGQGSNLARFMDLEDSIAGEVLTLAELGALIAR